jgi:hypothetical protein
MSMGLARLHRGGSFVSIAARRSSGSGMSWSDEPDSASAAMTPHPPAVVTTTVFGPRGSGCVAKVAAASNASSMVPARHTPAWRMAPVKIRCSPASAPVCDAAACRPAPVTPPLTRTTGSSGVTARIPSKVARPSAVCSM